MHKRKLIFSAAIAAVFAFGLQPAPGNAAGTDVPAAGQSAKIDAIKARGTLKAAAIGEFPWLAHEQPGRKTYSLFRTSAVGAPSRSREINPVCRRVGCA